MRALGSSPVVPCMQSFATCGSHGPQFSFLEWAAPLWVILVRMTRISKSKLSTSKRGKARPPKGRSGYWLLQDAKARFSELVRKVRSSDFEKARVTVFNPWVVDVGSNFDLTR